MEGAVESRGKTIRLVGKAAREAPIRAKGVRNWLPARIFTVDNRYNESTIQNGQVSQLSPNPMQSRFAAGHE